MLMTKERRPAIRTLRGWAILVLQETGAIRDCEEHGWSKDRADPHARERAFEPLRTKPWPKYGTCWIRSATRAPSVRPTSRNDGCFSLTQVNGALRRRLTVRS
ncbi:hypothetical protein ACVWWO_007488 [Bradyrhizobium sp. F1.13.1]